MFTHNLEKLIDRGPWLQDMDAALKLKLRSVAAKKSQKKKLGALKRFCEKAGYDIVIQVGHEKAERS